MSYARLRPEYRITWESKELDLRDLEGNELYWVPQKEWVKALCFDSMQSGLYVLTEDDEYYFTCHSIYLEHSDTIPTATPTETKEKKMGKHAGSYDLKHDLAESEDALLTMLGQDLDTWQLIARDLARDILRGRADSEDSMEFALDILTRLYPMPEMNIHPSELGKIAR